MPIPPRTPLLTLLKLEQEHAKALRNALVSSAKKVETQLSALGDGGNPITRMQLEAQRASIKGYLDQDFDDIQTAVKLGQKEAAAAASHVTSLYEEQLTSLVMDKTARNAIAASEALRAANGVEAAMRRMEGSSYIPLSKQVYNTQRLSNKYIDRILNDALITGKTWKQLAKEVAGSINPNVKGGVSYAAERLARTEINNAFHASAAKRYDESVIVEGVDWHLSSSHPEGDVCDDLAAGSPYKKKDVPQKPHPHCYCFITPALPSEEEFMDNLFAGKYGDGAWAPKVSEKKVLDIVLPKVPTKEELEKMSAAAIKREYDAASRQHWDYRRGYTGSDLANDPMGKALEARYRAFQDMDIQKRTEAAARAKAKKAAAKAAGTANTKISKLPKMGGGITPANLQAARTGANPRGREWANDRNELDYQINCTRVATATELRMRGYNVSASPAGRDMDFTKNDYYTKRNWIDPKTGRAPTFTKGNDAADLRRKMEAFPEGSRFLIHGAWKQGGAHIWNAEIRNGRMYFVEAQTNTWISKAGGDKLTDHYLNSLSFGDHGRAVEFFRVDNLEPTDYIMGESARTAGKLVPPYVQPVG